MVKYELRLYITGKSARSEAVIKRLEDVLKNSPELKGKYKLEVIDILERPQLAEDEKIVATPLLEKRLPKPVRRILGELSRKEKLLVGLDIVELGG